MTDKVNDDDADKENEIDSCDLFWRSIENETGSQIPTYIRNILELNGFNSEMSIKLLEVEDLDEIEKLVQSGTMSTCVPKDFDLSSLYGPFKDSPEKFTFLRGYRKMLLAIAMQIKEKGMNRNPKSASKSKRNSLSLKKTPISNASLQSTSLGGN